MRNRPRSWHWSLRAVAVAVAALALSGGAAGVAGASVAAPAASAADTVSVVNPGNETSSENQQVSLQIQAASSSGGALTYSAAGLPPFLQIGFNTGVITGCTCNFSGTYQVTVTATDSAGATGSASFTWVVQPSGSVWVTDPLNQATIDTAPVSLQISAAAPTGETLAYSATGLPPGLAIDAATGLISGTPDVPGAYNVIATATATTGSPPDSGSAPFLWVIQPDTITVYAWTQHWPANRPYSQQFQATSSIGAALSFSAAGLPPGLAIDPATGILAGRPSAPGTYHSAITVTDTTTATASVDVAWHITAQLLGNRGFESGRPKPWLATSGVLTRSSRAHPSHAGRWLARLDGRGKPHTDRLSQKVRIPAAASEAKFSFYLEVRSNDPATKAFDTLKVEVLNSGGRVLRRLATYSNRTRNGRYRQHMFSLKSFAGRTVILKFVGRERLAGHDTAFLVDSTALNVG